MLVCSQENPSKLKSLNHNYSLNGTVPLGWLVLHSGVYHNFHYWNMALFLLLQVNWTRNRTKWLTGQCDYISSAHYCPHIFFYAFFFSSYFSHFEPGKQSASLFFVSAKFSKHLQWQFNGTCNMHYLKKSELSKILKVVASQKWDSKLKFTIKCCILKGSLWVLAAVRA